MDSRIQVSSGRNGLEKVELIYDEDNSAEIYCNGAHVTSWRSSGEEMLFLSERSRFSAGQPIRGGIPLVFPQFGPGELPQHGFARNSLWRVVSEGTGAAGAIEIVLELDDSRYTRAMWDHAFRAELGILLTEELGIELRVTNRDNEAFEFTAALHTYFAVSNIASAYIYGLRNLDYLDSLQERRRCRETVQKVSFDGEVDRIYLSTPDELSVVDEGSGRGVSIHKSGFPDAVVWNPWIEKARRMQDFGDEEYRRMVCVEAGAIASPVRLEKGRTWKGSQTLTARA